MVLGNALGLALTRQALHYLSYSDSPFCFGYFWDGVLPCAQACLDLDPLIFAFLRSWDGSWVPPCTATGWDGVSRTFCLIWLLTASFLISPMELGLQAWNTNAQLEFFFFGLGFELRAYTLSYSSSPVFVMGYFEIGSGKLFALAGFKPRSFWSLPPE
jgi:hypothetical protein